MRLDLSDIRKSFGGVCALDGASLSAGGAEIHALCGENGAGKSTLLKVLSGVHPHGSFTGRITLDGAELRLASPAAARASGIAMVHQELMLVPELSVADNLLLGREPTRAGLLDDLALQSQAHALLRRYSLDTLDPNRPVGELGIGLQQMVEIIRALAQNAKLLILDEPTAALSSSECDQLHHWLRALKRSGTTCLYVSHRMDEIFALCDRITVLRDGRTTGTVTTADTTPAHIIEQMVGRAIPQSRPRNRELRGHEDATAKNRAASNAHEGTEESCKETRPAGGRGRRVDQGVSLQLSSVPSPVTSAVRASAETKITTASADSVAVDLDVPTSDRVALEVRGLGIAGVLEDISFSVAPGEVVAIAGAMGSGRTALLSSLFGAAHRRVDGEIRVHGELVRLRQPADAILAGIALVPEDRKGQGLVLGLSAAENLSLPVVPERGRGWLARIGFVDDLADQVEAERRIAQLRVRGSAPSETATLSGGNQQKIALGKWLGAVAPRVLLLDEPTRGVDVGAREEIYALLDGLRRQGLAIVMASSDLPEVLRLADRILVLRGGRIAGELDARGATESDIVSLSTGASLDGPRTNAPTVAVAGSTGGGDHQMLGAM